MAVFESLQKKKRQNAKFALHAYTTTVDDAPRNSSPTPHMQFKVIGLKVMMLLCDRKEKKSNGKV